MNPCPLIAGRRMSGLFTYQNFGKTIKRQVQCE
jgi:hypothetical protein